MRFGTCQHNGRVGPRTWPPKISWHHSRSGGITAAHLQKCRNILGTTPRAVGFEPVGEEWPFVYLHKKLKLVLAVHVDERTKLKIETTTGLGLHLGWWPMTRQFLRSCVGLCQEAAGNIELNNALFMKAQTERPSFQRYSCAWW